MEAESDEDDFLLEDGNANDHLLENGDPDEQSDEPCFSDADSDASSEGKLVARWLRSHVPEEVRQDLAVLKDWEPPTEYGEHTPAEFRSFVDREKSRGIIFPSLTCININRAHIMSNSIQRMLAFSGFPSRRAGTTTRSNSPHPTDEKV